MTSSENKWVSVRWSQVRRQIDVLDIRLRLTRAKKEVKENIEILTFLLASLLFLAVRHLEDGPVEALRE